MKCEAKPNPNSMPSVAIWPIPLPNRYKSFFQKLGPFEYQVACRVLPEEQVETWIHIDGIAEERERLKQIGNTEHPVFSLVCLGDLFALTLPSTLRI